MSMCRARCKGKRYNRETLECAIGKTIADVLNMTVDEELAFFESIPPSAQALHLHVGLDYIKLGQPATTSSPVSGGAARSSRHGARHGTRRTLYILDEPTTGLHFADIRLLEVPWPPGRFRQQRGGHRAQPGRDQGCGLVIDTGPREGGEGRSRRCLKAAGGDCRLPNPYRRFLKNILERG